ncbi:MAG: cytochrome c3 family protein [Chloroflexota bacterium]
MKRLNLRLIAVSIAISLLWLLSSNVKASPSIQPDPPPTPVPPGVSVPGEGTSPNAHDDLPDCRECHWDIYLIWEESSHGKGLSCGQCHLAASEEENHARSGHGAQGGGSQECMACHTTGYDSETDTWVEGDIHCTSCHNPIDSNHPDVPAPINRSADLCGQCHIQANFEWQVSTHGMAGVSCIDCHNQHRASLKAGSEDISDQCAACHESRESGYATSMHAGEGLSCASCHLAPLENNPLGRGNAKLNHTFNVDISVCMQCHGENLHAPVLNGQEEDDHHSTEGRAIDAMASIIDADVTAAPPSLNPNGFLAFATVFGTGVGGGAVIGIARFIQKSRGRKKK